MVGLFYILLFWLIGNALSLVTGGYVSGNIIGMILLFAALCMRWVRAETVRPAARFLLGAMALFFVPYGVGLMDSYRVILENLGAIVVSAHHGQDLPEPEPPRPPAAHQTPSPRCLTPLSSPRTSFC